MKMRLIMIVAFALLTSATVHADDIWKFDFGAEAGQLASGFRRVTALRGYDAELGYGFADASGMIEDDMTVDAGAVITVDPLSRDRIFRSKTFLVDVPNGTYHLAVFTGNFTHTVVRHLEIHRYLTDELTIDCEGEQIYRRPAFSVDEYFGEDGPYFGSANTFYREGQSLWDAYMARHFPIIRATVEVTDGKLELQCSRDLGISGLVIWPDAKRAEGETVLTDIEAMRRSFFDEYYIYASAETEANPITAGADDERAGMVLFSRHPMQHVYPETFPAMHERDRPAQTLATRGEKALLQVACVPLRDLGTVRARVSDLTGPGRIAADAVEVRYARYDYFLPRGSRQYSVEPKLLVETDTVPAGRGVARSFYLRIAVPADAAPGIYEGTVTFVAAGGAELSLPLQVRVLPFELPAQPLAIGGYYGLPSGNALRMYRFTQADTEPFANMIRRWNAAHFALMRDLGMTHVSTNTWWRPFIADEQGNVTMSEPAHRYNMMLGDLIRDAGFESFSMFGIGWSALMDGVPGFLSRHHIGGKRPEQIVFPDSALVPAAAVIKAMYDEAKQRNWPSLPFYVSDELGNEGAIGADYGEALVKFLVKARDMSGHDFKLIASTLRFSSSERMLAHLDAIIPNAAWPINPQTIAAARDAGAELWLYNIGENRLSFGYYPWRVDAKARLQWAWDWNARSMDPLFGLDGSATQYDVVMGPGIKAIPSYGWLVLAAEGAKDHRYIVLLNQKLAAQPDGPAADAARAVVDELKQRVSETYLDDVNNWQPTTYDYFRWRIAEAIMAFD